MQRRSKNTLERKQPLFQQEAGLVLPFGVHVLWHRDVMASAHVVATQASPQVPLVFQTAASTVVWNKGWASPKGVW